MPIFCFRPGAGAPATRTAVIARAYPAWSGISARGHLELSWRPTNSRPAASRRELTEESAPETGRDGYDLPRRGEELQRDVVRVAEGEPRAIRCVDDSAVGDP